MKAFFVRTSRRILFILAKTVGLPYAWLRRMGLLRIRAPRGLIKLMLMTPRGPLVKYVWRGRTIARWWIAARRWECQKPFDLFLSPPATSQPPANPEMALLLDCVRPGQTSAHAILGGAAGHAGSGIDWQAFVQLARDHHVVPLAYRALLEASKRPEQGTWIPSHVLDELKQLQFRISAFNLRVSAELACLVRRFEEAGIVAIPVKGPVLALQAYGSTSLRQYEDLDFAVPREHILALSSAMLERGYQSTRTPEASRKQAYLNSLQDWQFYDEKRHLIVDVKPVLLSHLTSRPSEISWLQGTLQPIALDRHTIQAPSRLAMLILACMHGTNNVWAKASLLADVAALACQLTPSEWETLLPQASAIGKRRDVLVGLALAHNILGTNLPAEIERSLYGHRQLESLISHATTRLMMATARVSPIDVFSFERRTRSTLRDAFRCIMRFLLVPSSIEWRLVRLPRPLMFLYPLVRLARLASSWLHPARDASLTR